MTFQKKKSVKRWIPRPYDSHVVAQLSKQTGISPVITQILAGRGVIDPAQIILFLAPCNLAKGLHPPERLPGCEKAARLIAEAIQNKSPITIYGDYDVDGMTATAILTGAIGLLGGKVNYFVPNRLEEGYGLNCDTIKRLRDDGTSMIITVDCGITSFPEAECAKELGIDLIITDHHTPLTDPKTHQLVLPESVAIVHPRIDVENPDESRPYPCPELCGAAVALKLAWGIGKVVQGEDTVSPEMREFLIGAIGLAALGTVADVVPLKGENRTIVRFALEKSLVRNLPLGLKHLLQAAGLNHRKQITSEDIGFAIAPRLNAAGREVLHFNNDKDEDDIRHQETAQSLLQEPNRLAVTGQMGLASLGVELLITHQESRAVELAAFVNNLNETRQKLERKIMAEAMRQIEKEYADDPAFVLASSQWHPGVVGIVAGRIAEHFHRPTVMISLRNNGPGTGSARGIPDSNFSLYDAFEHCQEYLERFGGHAAAAGLGIKESNIPAFRNAFCDYVAENLPEEAKIPTLHIDTEFLLSMVTCEVIADLDKMAPFGAGNMRPVFVTFRVALVGAAQRIGAKFKVRKNPGEEPEETVARTFSARFRQYQDERRAIAFGKGDWVEEINHLVAKDSSVRFDIAFQIIFNDRTRSPELRLVDWRVSE